MRRAAYRPTYPPPTTRILGRSVVLMASSIHPPPGGRSCAPSQAYVRCLLHSAARVTEVMAPPRNHGVGPTVVKAARAAGQGLRRVSAGVRRRASAHPRGQPRNHSARAHWSPVWPHGPKTPPSWGDFLVKNFTKFLANIPPRGPGSPL